MAREVERKFLVASDGWRAAARQGAQLRQFYLAAQEDRSVRVRIRDDAEARLTMKFGTQVRVRDEFEYAIPYSDALELMGFALGAVIDKTRHVVSHAGHDYEVDVFAGALTGLVIAELETEDEVHSRELPAWLGREVTGEAAFYNASLALHGLPREVA